MSTAAEPVSTSHDADTTRQHNNATATLVQEPAVEQDHAIAGRLSSGTPGEPPGEGATKILRHPTLSHSANTAVRAIALKRAQQQYGNQFIQRAIAGIYRSPSRTSLLQRQCACGGTCAKCSTAPTPGLVPESSYLVQAQTHGDSDALALTADTVRPTDSSGQPLGGQTRQTMESYFGKDLGNVRVHTGPSAARAAESIQADAYTVGHDIYFGEGKYDTTSSEGRQLISHELTHVVQQEAGQSPTQVSTSRDSSVAIGDPHDPLEHEAEANAKQFSAEERHEAAITSDSTGIVRRAVWNSFADNPITNTLGEGVHAVGSGVKAGIRKGKEFVVAQIEQYAPGAIKFFRGLKDYFKNAVSKGIDGLFGGIVSSIKEKGLGATLAELIGNFASGALQAAGNFVSGSCTAIGKLAEYVVDLHIKLGSMALDQVKTGLTAVSGALDGLWKEYGAPAVDIVKKKLKAIWKDVEDTAGKIWDALKPLRKAAGEVWDAVTEFLSDGKKSWDQWYEGFVQHALDAWDKLKEKLKPLMGKVKQVAKVIGIVLLLLPPHGSFVVLGALIYGLYQGAKALWEKWGKPFTKAVRQWWVSEGFPVVQGKLTAFQAAIDSVKKAISGALSLIYDELMGVLDAVGALSFLESVKDAISGFAKKVTAFKDDVDKKVAEWSTKAKSLLAAAEPYLNKFKEALRQTLLIATLGPFALLDDGVWNTAQRVTAFIMTTPCLREIGGLVGLPRILSSVGRIRQNVKAGWELIKNPTPAIEALRKAIEPMVLKIEPAVRARIEGSFTEREMYIQVSVLHYLSQSFSELGVNWWSQLKHMGWDLLWPWDTVGKEFMPMLTCFGDAISSVFNLEFSKATDKFLEGMKKFNGIAGALSGWFLLASVLIGAALGALGFVTGPGGVATVGAGASAGLAFAEEVGIALLVIALATEAAAMDKATFDLRYQNIRIKDKEERDKEDQEDCKAIATSVISLVTLGALMLLGAIAMKFGRWLAGLAERVPFISDLAALLKSAKKKVGDFSLVEGEGAGAKPTGEGGTGVSKTAEPPADTPEAKSGTGDKANADPDTTAKVEDFSPEDIHTADKKLADKVSDPKNVREVTDPALNDKYDVEVDLGDGQTYRRRKDGTWCLFRNPTTCGNSQSTAVNAAADAAKQKLDALDPVEASQSGPGKGQVTPQNVNRVKGMQRFLTRLDQKRLTLNDLNLTPDKVIDLLNKDPVQGMKELNDRLDIRESLAETQRGSSKQKIDTPYEDTPPEKIWTREEVLGDTPGKDSRTGREVRARMRAEGKLTGTPPNELVYHEPTKSWYRVEDCDMGHTRDAVNWWNAEGRFYEPKSQTVRDWMLDSQNYELEPSPINKSRGAQLTERYQSPLPDPITSEELQGIPKQR